MRRSVIKCYPGPDGLTFLPVTPPPPPYPPPLPSYALLTLVKSNVLFLSSSPTYAGLRQVSRASSDVTLTRVDSELGLSRVNSEMMLARVNSDYNNEISPLIKPGDASPLPILEPLDQSTLDKMYAP